jgi:hypothetical protein
LVRHSATIAGLPCTSRQVVSTDSVMVLMSLALLLRKSSRANSASSVAATPSSGSTMNLPGALDSSRRRPVASTMLAFTLPCSRAPARTSEPGM